MSHRLINPKEAREAATEAVRLYGETHPGFAERTALSWLRLGKLRPRQ